MKSEKLVFSYIGNNLAIDFLNTRVVDSGESVELLNNTQDLFNWASGAELSIDSSVKNQDLTKVLEFREVLIEIFVMILDDRDIPSKVISNINQHLVNHSAEQELEKVKNRLKLRPTHKKLTLIRLMGLIANEAATLLTSKQLEKVKRCANPKCVLLFLDTSKSGKRRWCSMDVCGNRAKVASHYLNKH